MKSNSPEFNPGNWQDPYSDQDDDVSPSNQRVPFEPEELYLGYSAPVEGEGKLAVSASMQVCEA